MGIVTNLYWGIVTVRGFPRDLYHRVYCTQSNNSSSESLATAQADNASEVAVSVSDRLFEQYVRDKQFCTPEICVCIYLDVYVYV